MAPLARVRPCWPGQLPTTQTAPSSGSLAVSWCRSTLGRAVAWSESSSSWPGDPHVCVIHFILCASPVTWSESCLSLPGGPHVCAILSPPCMTCTTYALDRADSSLSWSVEPLICTTLGVACMFGHMVRELFVMASRFSRLCYTWSFMRDMYTTHALRRGDSRTVREFFVMAR